MDLKQLVDNSRFTILLGKNGSGKSSKLRELSNSFDSKVTYISPERGGTLKYDPGVDNNIATNENWLKSTRNQNRLEQFRQQSAAQFRNLEVLILREIAKNRSSTQTFDEILDSINDLLPAVSIVQSDRGFVIKTKDLTDTIDEQKISSGESELISLAIEILVFSRQSDSNKLLLLDEPDVHLHPDLQQKLIKFLEDVATRNNFKVAIATHSTALIGAFSKAADLQIVPILNRAQTNFEPFERSTVSDQLIPIFGAHPLSSQFNKSPILLLEGDDDFRVFDQIVRSSNGRFSFSPCAVGSVSELNKWETWLNKFLPVIYDTPEAFSLRDLDASEQSEIENNGIVKRLRLNCYSIENLLLCTESLTEHGFNSLTFKNEIKSWAEARPNHKSSAELSSFVENFNSRRTINLKNIRNIIVAVLDSTKPWEVIIGQTIARNLTSNDTDENSLKSYLGPKILSELFNS